MAYVVSPHVPSPMPVCKKLKRKSCIERSSRSHVRSAKLYGRLGILSAPIFSFLHTFVDIKQNELTSQIKSEALGIVVVVTSPSRHDFCSRSSCFAPKPSTSVPHPFTTSTRLLCSFPPTIFCSTQLTGQNNPVPITHNSVASNCHAYTNTLRIPNWLGNFTNSLTW